jgi:hypothetical protein
MEQFIPRACVSHGSLCSERHPHRRRLRRLPPNVRDGGINGVKITNEACEFGVMNPAAVKEAAAIRCFLSRGEEGVVSPKNEEFTSVRPEKGSPTTTRTRKTDWFCAAIGPMLARAAPSSAAAPPARTCRYRKFHPGSSVIAMHPTAPSSRGASRPWASATDRPRHAGRGKTATSND